MNSSTNMLWRSQRLMDRGASDHYSQSGLHTSNSTIGHQDRLLSNQGRSSICCAVRSPTGREAHNLFGDRQFYRVRGQSVFGALIDF